MPLQIRKHYSFLVENSNIWKNLYEQNNFNKDTPIKREELMNPESEIVKIILRIYSTKSFLPYILNKAIRENTKNKDDTLGPYYFVLQKIIEF